jgi:hypothetical protein
MGIGIFNMGGSAIETWLRAKARADKGECHQKNKTGILKPSERDIPSSVRYYWVA